MTAGACLEVGEALLTARHHRHGWCQRKVAPGERPGDLYYLGLGVGGGGTGQNLLQYICFCNWLIGKGNESDFSMFAFAFVSLVLRDAARENIILPSLSFYSLTPTGDAAADSSNDLVLTIPGFCDLAICGCVGFLWWSTTSLQQTTKVQKNEVKLSGH